LETAFAADGSGQGAWVENQVPAITDTVWASQGYVRLASGTVADGLYARSGRVLPSLAATFYRPEASLDVYGGRADVTWDAEGLFPASMQMPEVPGATGPVRLTQSFEHDYRVLAPWRVTDPNGNRSAVRFDAAGRPLAMALLGKTTDTGTDSLDEPTARYAYVLNSWDVSVPEDRVPPHVIAQQKEQFGEAWDLADPDFRYQESIAYSDGFGRDAGSRQRVESGTLTPGGTTVTERWVMAGRVIYDAKGRPVQQFEPCFVEGSTWSPDDLVAHGVASTLHYDAAGRVHRVDMPDGTHARTVFSPWRIEQWDTNDTVLDSDWLNRTDIDEAAKEASQRVARTPLLLDMDALGRARRLERVRRDHAWNPGSGYTQFDRPLLTDVSHVETVTLDIEGRALACTNARGNTVYSATYSVSALPLAVSSKDTGRSWALFRADGRPWLSWTGVETAAASESAAPRYRTRMTYDALHRPVARFLQTDDARVGEDDIIETVREWSIYGERATDAADDNRLGTAWRAFDAAGMVESTGFTFAGQPLGSLRRLTSDWVGQPDWTAALQALTTSVSAAQTEADTLLETTAYATAMTWDALGRPVTTTSPAESGRTASTTTFGYDRGGRWKSTTLTLRGAVDSTTIVADVQYNARGQRTRIVHGSGVTTTSTYDPFSFRLTRQHAVRDPSGTPVSLQDLLYTFDAAGTVVRLVDDAQQSVWFDNAVVDAVWTYGHDDLGRLVWATGREHAQAAGPAPWGEPHARQALPNPGPTAMHAYSETYAYDAAGNLLEHEHTVPSNSAASRTRTYTYETENHRMATAEFEGDLSPRTVAHDSLGRMTSLPGVDFAEWDDANNLVFTKTSSGASQRVYYVYDAGGQRVRKVVEEYLASSWTRTKETRYLGGFELQLKFVGGSLNHERETLHVMDDTRRVALFETDTVDDGDPLITPTPLLRYQFDNHLRSACVETNAAGEVISYEEFHPYGTTAYLAGLGALDANPKRYRYSGKERDAESGLCYYGARYLAPWLGRWVSPDPAGFVDGVNVYQMCSGMPSTKYDPDGRDPEDMIRLGQDPLAGVQEGLGWIIGRVMEPFIGEPVTHDEVRRENDAQAAELNSLADFIDSSEQYLLLAVAAYSSDALERAYDEGLSRDWRLATSEELEEAIPDVQLRELVNTPNHKGFRAQLFRNDSTQEWHLAFAGTDSYYEVFPVDILNGLGVPTADYMAAHWLGEEVSESIGDGALSFSGHSLGGGLATAAVRAAFSHGRERAAYTLNPAGTDWNYRTGSDTSINRFRIAWEVVGLIQPIRGAGEVVVSPGEGDPVERHLGFASIASLRAYAADLRGQARSLQERN
jgi:RHS repeat-associated protein